MMNVRQSCCLGRADLQVGHTTPPDIFRRLYCRVAAVSQQRAESVTSVRASRWHLAARQWMVPLPSVSAQRQVLGAVGALYVA